MPKWPGFCGGYAKGQSLVGNAADTVNFYVEKLPGNSASEAALLSVPGFSAWSTVASVGTRGAILVGVRLFAIIGATLWEFDSNGTSTNRGTVVQDQNPAQLISDGTVGGQIGICSGGHVYSYDLASNVLSATILVTGVTHLSFAAGFGLAFQATTGKVFLSALEDLSTYDFGTFFQRSLFPDPWQASFVDSNNLFWGIGTETFEVWQNTGTGTQPWAPLSGLVGLYGIGAPFAYALSAAGNTWLASNKEGFGQLVLTRGAAPSIVSSGPIATLMAQILRTERVTDAEMLCYQQEGHTFASVSFPSASVTLTYDITSDSWARRGRWNVNRGAYDVWSPRTHVVAYGLHLVGDRTTGFLARMDPTIATELDGTGIRCQRVSPPLVNELKRFPVDRLELLMDVGLGTQAGQGQNPQAVLEISMDGGLTYGNQIPAGIGRAGEYRRRVYWNRLGLQTDAVARVTFSDPSPKRIVDAYLNNLENPGRQAA